MIDSAYQLIENDRRSQITPHSSYSSPPISSMKFHGQLILANFIVVHQLEGELQPQILDNGKTLYRGHFSTAENTVLNQNDIYTLLTSTGQKTKIKVLAQLTDFAGIRVYSMYATHPLK